MKHKEAMRKTVKRLKTVEGYALIVKDERKTRAVSVFSIKDLVPPGPTDNRLDALPKILALTLRTDTALELSEMRVLRNNTRSV
jgi:hypothetical protein